MSMLIKHLGIGIRAIAILTVIFGIIYPLAMWGIGALVNRDGTTGSIVSANGQEVASALIAQDTSGPQWFHPRPSAAGDGYDTSASGGSNLGTGSEELLALVEERRQTVADEEGVAPQDVPADAVTASASGLDPHISPEYADIQVPRVATENGLSENEVRKLVAQNSSGGVISPKVVNVVTLNVALSEKVNG